MTTLEKIERLGIRIADMLKAMDEIKSKVEDATDLLLVLEKNQYDLEYELKQEQTDE